MFALFRLQLQEMLEENQLLNPVLPKLNDLLFLYYSKSKLFKSHLKNVDFVLIESLLFLTHYYKAVAICTV